MTSRIATREGFYGLKMEKALNPVGKMKGIYKNWKSVEGSLPLILNSSSVGVRLP